MQVPPVLLYSDQFVTLSSLVALIDNTLRHALLKVNPLTKEKVKPCTGVHVGAILRGPLDLKDKDLKIWVMSKPLIEKVRKMSPKTRNRFFSQASAEQVEELTVPCSGEAHSNPHIDHCMMCLGIKWGRMLKQ